MLKSINNNIEAQFLGLIEFDQALNLQNELVQICATKNTQFILGLEHPQVMTLGLRAHHTPLNELCSMPWTDPVIKISRGGLATIHNPGQLVIYPIINLRENGLPVRGFVQNLFSTTQKTLKEFNIESTMDLCDQPGLYTAKGKIAFCGLQIRNGITMHGISINIHNDITVFSSFQSCGIAKSHIDSLAQHGVTISTRDFFQKWLNHFNLSTEMPKACTAELNLI